MTMKKRPGPAYPLAAALCRPRNNPRHCALGVAGLPYGLLDGRQSRNPVTCLSSPGGASPETTPPEAYTDEEHAKAPTQRTTKNKTAHARKCELARRRLRGDEFLERVTPFQPDPSTHTQKAPNNDAQRYAETG